MGGAIEQLSVRQARARREFAARFESFDSREVESAYDSITGVGPTKSKKRKKKNR